ncbi:MAG: MCE family protein [Desulfobacterales bacterium]|nr:MCE family protein [Desulfobacterales bacterium]
MASLRTKFSVGLFVVIGFAVTIVAVIWIGMSSYFEKGRLYVAYFDESVQGLDKDSPVKYRGVSIGRVDSIGVAPDANLIQVVLKIEKGLESKESRKNIVARLKSVGITGIMFVELDQKKHGEPNLSPRLNFSPQYPVIVTKPSGIKKLFEGVDDVISQLRSLDMKGISDKLKSTIDKINQAIEDTQIKGVSSDIRSSLERVQRILDDQRWNKVIDSVEKATSTLSPLASDANETVSRLNKTITRLDRIVADNEKEFAEAIYDLKRSMKKANIILGDGLDLIKDADKGISSLNRHLPATLDNLEKATENLNRLIELLSNQPAQLFFGEPPPSKKVEPDTD